MKILFNLKNRESKKRGDPASFLQALAAKLAENNPDHDFILLVDNTCPPNKFPHANTRVISSGSWKFPKILQRFYCRIILSRIVNKTLPDLLITPGISSGGGLPAPIFLITGAKKMKDFLSIYPGPRDPEKRFMAVQKEANWIWSTSHYFRQEWIKKYGVPEEKISVVPVLCAKEFQPLNEPEKEMVRNKFSGGKPFFFFVMEFHISKNLINLLKAFSIFKKRQKSNWKLVVAMGTDTQGKLLTRVLDTYKYRDDLVVLSYLPGQHEFDSLLASAYALLCPFGWDGYSSLISAAFRCLVPVLALDEPGTRHYAGNAALYFDSADYLDIAEGMMRIYKDEDMLQSLIHNAQIKNTENSWDKVAALAWIDMAHAASSGKQDLK